MGLKRKHGEGEREMLRAQGIQKEIEREAQAEAYRCCGRSNDTRKKGERSMGQGQGARSGEDACGRGKGWGMEASPCERKVESHT